MPSWSRGRRGWTTPRRTPANGLLLGIASTAVKSHRQNELRQLSASTELRYDKWSSSEVHYSVLAMQHRTSQNPERLPDMRGKVFACVVSDTDSPRCPAETELVLRGARVTRLLFSTVFPKATLDSPICRVLARLYDGLIVPEELDLNPADVATAVGVPVLSGGGAKEARRGDQQSA